MDRFPERRAFDLHLELLAFLDGVHERGEELRDLSEILQADDLDRWMHVAAGPADQRARGPSLASCGFPDTWGSCK
jgi:hypothetical protein